MSDNNAPDAGVVAQAPVTSKAARCVRRYANDMDGDVAGERQE